MPTLDLSGSDKQDSWDGPEWRAAYRKLPDIAP